MSTSKRKAWKYRSLGIILSTMVIPLTQPLVLLFGNQMTSVLAQAPVSQSKDVVIRWNAIALNLIRTEKTSPPMAARNLAMLHVAVYDAVNGVLGTHKPYRSELRSATASVDAAATVAAYQILINLYPQQTTTLEATFKTALAEIPEGQSKQDGIQLGQKIADQTITLRQDDGANAKEPYTPINKPGMWQPIPPDLKPASMTHWKKVKPFAMTQGSQFRIAKMPSLTSAEYIQEFNYAKSVGAKESKIRTADQSIIWLDGSGTLTPPGHWNQITEEIAAQKKNTTAQNARLFALLNIALADASIIDSDQKYTFNRWRPLTAIRGATQDSNPKTVADPIWASLLPTPNSPAYVSGHSTFSGAADVVLTAFFGKEVGFTTVADPALGFTPRQFKSFTQAANEAGMSRVYGGVHWLSDNRDGLVAGQNLGRFVVQNVLTLR
jgi:hypothetical protein